MVRGTQLKANSSEPDKTCVLKANLLEEAFSLDSPIFIIFHFDFFLLTIFVRSLILVRKHMYLFNNYSNEMSRCTTVSFVTMFAKDRLLK